MDGPVDCSEVQLQCSFVLTVVMLIPSIQAKEYYLIKNTKICSALLLQVFVSANASLHENV